MKLFIVLVFLMIGLAQAQERSYIEFIPMTSWENIGDQNANQPSFDWRVQAHLKLSNIFAIEPFIEQRKELSRNREFGNELDFTQWSAGVGIRFYLVQ